MPVDRYPRDFITCHTWHPYLSCTQEGEAVIMRRTMFFGVAGFTLLAACVFSFVTYVMIPLCWNEPPITTSFRRPYADDRQSGPYCGLYCFFATMSYYNRPVKFQDLLKNEYIS